MNSEKKKLGVFGKIVIAECIVLLLCAVILRLGVFPYLAHGGMKHVVLATHTFMIGLTATLFSLFAIVFCRKWKSHKKYVILPAVFMVFGYILLMLANEINF
ncbi:MAG: hypothetical protein IJO83_07440 [Clostridia bacterium]|nr:hypothetical protein [Clostridia bacterium]